MPHGNNGKAYQQHHTETYQFGQYQNQSEPLDFETGVQALFLAVWLLCIELVFIRAFVEMVEDLREGYTKRNLKNSL